MKLNSDRVAQQKKALALWSDSQNSVFWAHMEERTNSGKLSSVHTGMSVPPHTINK